MPRRAAPLRDSHVGTAGTTTFWRGEWRRAAEETVLWPYPRHRPTPMAIPRLEYSKYTMWAPTLLERFQEYLARGASPPNAVHPRLHRIGGAA